MTSSSRTAFSNAAGKEIKLLSERDPADLAWADLGVDVVLESTGFFTKRDGAQKHLDAGAKKVVISAPATDPDLTLVLGVNDDEYDADSHHIVSNASCTTNCVAPLAKVLHDSFTVEQGFMTTIHAYTNDQRILDLPHEHPPRPSRRDQPDPDLDRRRARDRARAAGAEGQGRRDVDAGARADRFGHRSRLPRRPRDHRRRGQGQRPHGRVVWLGSFPTSSTWMTRIVSTDIQRSPYSCVFDAELTMVNARMVKVFGWYDNEWGYSCRLVDLIGKLL